MPMGTTRKVMAIYRTRGPWWRHYGLAGDIFASSLPDKLSTFNGQPIFPECYDTSPFAREHVGVLTCFVEGNANLHFSSLTEDEQRHLFLDYLQWTFQDYTATKEEEDIWKPDEIFMYNWADDPHIRGAYTSFFGPGTLSHLVWWSAYRTQEKAPGILVAGADYHAGFGNGYMEGAVRSGQQAADLIVEHLKQRQQQYKSDAATTTAE